MHPFKKMILSLSSSAETTSVTPRIAGGEEDGVFCYGQVQMRVFTSIPLKVNITATFGTGGNWLDASYLTGGNKITAPLIDSVITYGTFYNFGIDGADSGSGLNTSSITIEITDNATDELLDTFTYYRNHGDTPC